MALGRSLTELTWGRWGAPWRLAPGGAPAPHSAGSGSHGVRKISNWADLRKVRSSLKADSWRSSCSPPSRLWIPWCCSCSTCSHTRPSSCAGSSFSVKKSSSYTAVFVATNDFYWRGTVLYYCVQKRGLESLLWIWGLSRLHDEQNKRSAENDRNYRASAQHRLISFWSVKIVIFCKHLRGILRNMLPVHLVRLSF